MLRTTEKDLQKFLDRIPPALCRVLKQVADGRGKFRQRSLDEIVDASGLTRRTVCRLIYLPSWKNVRVEVASKFIKGCDVDILHNFDAYEFSRKKAAQDFRHLKPFQRKLLFKAMGWPSENDQSN